jgi:hypothetical protein
VRLALPLQPQRRASGDTNGSSLCRSSLLLTRVGWNIRRFLSRFSVVGLRSVRPILAACGSSARVALWNSFTVRLGDLGAHLSTAAALGTASSFITLSATAQTLDMYGRRGQLHVHAHF